MQRSGKWKIGGKERHPNSIVPDVFDQPVPGLTTKPATECLAFQSVQGYSTSYTHPFYNQYDHLDIMSFAGRSYRTHEIFANTSVPKRFESPSSAKLKQRSMPLTYSKSERSTLEPIPQLNVFVAEAVIICTFNVPTGSHRPTHFNTPTSLEGAAKNFEPSKRVWWRNEFDGCPLDREPSDSEMWTERWLRKYAQNDASSLWRRHL